MLPARPAQSVCRCAAVPQASFRWPPRPLCSPRMQEFVSCTFWPSSWVSQLASLSPRLLAPPRSCCAAPPLLRNLHSSQAAAHAPAEAGLGHVDGRAMEKNPWYKNVDGPFLQWQGPVGIKEDGGGCTRARGRVGPMVVHRAAASRDYEGACGARVSVQTRLGEQGSACGGRKARGATARRRLSSGAASARTAAASSLGCGSRSFVTQKFSPLRRGCACPSLPSFAA